MALNKQQQGMYLRKLFENHHLDVMQHCDLYNYLDRCGFEKKYLHSLETAEGDKGVYRFFARTVVPREDYPEGTIYIIMSNGKYVSFSRIANRPEEESSFASATEFETLDAAQAALIRAHRFTGFQDAKLVPIKPKVTI